MVTYCAGGQFHAVAYDVVLISQDLQRIHSIQRFQAALGHRERIVGESDLLRLGIQLKHREIVHIAETVSILLDQIQLLAQLSTDMTGIVVRLILFVRNKEDGISGRKSCHFCQFSLHLFGNKFIDGSLVAHILCHFEITKSTHTKRSCKA